MTVAAGPAGARHRHHAGGTTIGLPDHAASAALPAGLYTVKILSPTLDPKLAIDEQVMKLCYSAEDSGAHRNIVMPAAERASCKQESLPIGDDLVFDDYCPDGQHRLRIFRINDASHQGTYRFVGKGHPPMMLEPTVQLRREGDCPTASTASPPAR